MTTHVCSKCNEPAFEQYQYPAYDEDGILLQDAAVELCWTCAADAGFCPGCGEFVAGNEAEEWYMRQYSVCSNCKEEFEEDNYESADDDWNY